jgi:undecaprenyl-diphosphatase
VAPLVVFALLAVAAMSGQPFAWEESVLRELHDVTSPALDDAAIWWSRIFHPQVQVAVTALIAVGFALRRQWRWTIVAIGTVAGALLVNTGAKALVERPRPALWPSLTGETSSGFPSGHAMTSFAFAALLVLLLWTTRWRGLALTVGAIWIALVALARLVLGAHYPTDLLAGWCLALSWVALVWRLAGVDRHR